MDTNTVISVIVPLSQDSPILSDVMEELNSTLSSEFKFYEIIIVDDNDGEGTSDLLAGILEKYSKIRYLKLSRSVGRNIVQTAGIDTSIGDYVVTFDPYCDPIKLIPSFVKECQKSGGIVQGVASNPHKRNFVREFAGKCFREYCRKRLRLDLRKGAEEFRVMSRQTVNAFVQSKDALKNLRISTLLLGYSHKFLPYSREPRAGEIDHRTFKGDLLNSISVAVSYSSHPLRLMIVTGAATIAVVVALSLVLTTICISDDATKVLGYILSLLIGICSLSLFAAIAVIGEYVLSVRRNPESRPQYLVERESCSSILLEDTVDSSIVKESL